MDKTLVSYLIIKYNNIIYINTNLKSHLYVLMFKVQIYFQKTVHS